MVGGFGMSGSLVPLHLASLFLLFVGGETTPSGSPSRVSGQEKVVSQCVLTAYIPDGFEVGGLCLGGVVVVGAASSSSVPVVGVASSSISRLILFFFSFSTSLNLEKSSFSICIRCRVVQAYKQT